ncbi:hypothetical protein DVJ77_18455 [Dyella tabacisoli]|uniref:Uncharacterized protein n=1 Tax=Dyella tabacisoli TaxID=2282381 RepID=A0A369UI08_9GAMM|nr:hypothetical protein DVJ77_18455 [Dyella tabacisoli]
MKLRGKSIICSLSLFIAFYAGLVGAVDNSAVIQGLGMRNPGSPDISKSKDFGRRFPNACCANFRAGRESLFSIDVLFLRIAPILESLCIYGSL